MLFTLILAASAAFTVNVVSIVAYTDEEDRKYYGYEPVNEKLKSIVIKSERKPEDEIKTIKYSPIINNYSSKSVSSIPVTTPIIAKPKPRRTPIKVIHDDWFMKHYDRICELEAISHRSVLEMYDHEAIFQQFADLKMLARNLAWEQSRAKQM